jgi:hypothetical protein
MITVKSGLLGNRHLIDGNENAILFQLTQVIKEHRALIIERLIADLPTYLDYKFQTKPNKDQLLQIKDKLIHLQEGGVNLASYKSLVDQLQNQSVVQLTDKLFFAEIDESVSTIIATKELKLFKQ